MSELRGTLLNPVDNEPSEALDYAYAGAAALRGSLAQDVDAEPVPDVRFPLSRITNRDSGVAYGFLDSVLKPDGRVTVRYQSEDGSTVTLPLSRLETALSEEGGAWSAVEDE